ncbi:MAG TPA: hypothetical protein DEA08_14410 [Planctomycetes bacterium]|nr:hypothetical protein [Planctomycetota bacterium]
MADAPPPSDAPRPTLGAAGAALAAACSLGALTLLIASAQLGPPTALALIKILTYLLGLGIPLAVVSLAVTSFGAGSVVRRRCRGLPEVRFSRTLFRTVYRGEFEHSGHGVQVFRDRVRVRVDAPSAAFTRADLRRLFRDESPSPYAVARASARQLVWAGVTTLRVNEGWLELRGPLLGSLSEVVQHALELATAPARIRVRPQSRTRDCPFCHQGLPGKGGEPGPTVRCVGCDTLHHAECWQDHGGCAVFSCRKSPQERARLEPVLEPPADAERELEIHVRARA